MGQGLRVGQGGWGREGGVRRGWGREGGVRSFSVRTVFCRAGEVFRYLFSLSVRTYIGTQLLRWNHSFVLQGLPTDQARDKKPAVMSSSPALHCVCMRALCVCVRVCVRVSIHLATFSNCTSLASRFIMRLDWSCFFALARSPCKTDRQTDKQTHTQHIP